MTKNTAAGIAFGLYGGGGGPLIASAPSTTAGFSRTALEHVKTCGPLAPKPAGEAKGSKAVFLLVPHWTSAWQADKLFPK